MTRRIGINEAPTIALGTAGRVQQIPVLETLNDGTHIPGKTTIADLTEHLTTGGGAGIRQIQKFIINPIATGVVVAPPRLVPRRFSASQTIKLDRPNDNLISGSLATFALSNGEIVLPSAGAYRYEINIHTIRRGDGSAVFTSPDDAETILDFAEQLSVDLVPALWAGTVLLEQIGKRTRHINHTQGAAWDSSLSFRPFIRLSDYITTNQSETIHFKMAVTNLGVESTSEGVSWQITTDQGDIENTIIIERL